MLDIIADMQGLARAGGSIAKAMIESGLGIVQTISKIPS